MGAPVTPFPGGGPGAPPPGGGGPPGALMSTVLGALSNKAATNPGQDLAQQQADLQGADPGQLLDQLNKVNQLLGVMFVQSFQRLPNVSNHISNTMKTLSRAIKEAQQAANTAAVVKRPIDQSMVNEGAQPNQPGGAPALGAAA